jgi:leucine dehydrogenase
MIDAPVPDATDHAPRTGPLPLPAGALAGGFEQLVTCHDPAAGLLALVCIDSTVLGPADGGVRMRPYATYEDAVHDVTRLARAMTLKFAAAGELRGGGKAVIVGDPRRDKTEALLRRFAQVVDGLGGAYWAGEDAGLTLQDMEVLRRGTPYVTTLPEAAGGAGDIAPATAAGVLHAMRACVARVDGEATLAGRTVAVQGVGACGAHAVRQLLAEGASVVVADLDAERVDAVLRAHRGAPVRAVAPDRILDVRADVFAPFAFGGVIDREALRRLQVRVIAGSANNVMVSDAVEREVVDRGITYAVDFIANAGGAIMDADRFRPPAEGVVGDHDRDRTLDRDGVPRGVATRLAAIGARTTSVLERAARERILPSAAATALAEHRLDQARRAASRDRRPTVAAHGSPVGAPVACAGAW